jgi:hypothetical protein
VAVKERGQFLVKTSTKMHKQLSFLTRVLTFSTFVPLMIVQELPRYFRLLLNPLCLLEISYTIQIDDHWPVSVLRAPHITNFKVFVTVLFNYMINVMFTLAEMLLAKNAAV